METETRGAALGWSPSALSAPEDLGLDEVLENQSHRAHPLNVFVRWLLVPAEPKGERTAMKRAPIASIVILAAAILAGAQEPPNTVVIQGMGVGLMAARPATMTGAPYSATITNESVQTLADGTRIVQSSSGTIARDSQGRTRQDTPLPSIGNLSAENAPPLVFIMDPVAQVTYTLDVTDKTAQKMTMPGAGPGAFGAMTASGRTPAGGVVSGGGMTMSTGGPAGGDAGNAVFFQSGSVAAVTAGGPPPPPMFFQKAVMAPDPSELKTEDLGSQTMEGLLVNGMRTTRTIPAGQIGNDRPLSIVTEVWTSPDLKIVVSSKRSDPRMGEQTFRLTNVTRSEPDASLFTAPPDFKVIEGPQRIMYGINK